MRPMLLVPRPLPLPLPQVIWDPPSLRVVEEGRVKVVYDGLGGIREALRVLHGMEEALYDRLVLLPPFGIRLMPHLTFLDQESVDIRSVSLALREAEGFRGVNRLWRALVRLVPLKGKVVGVVGSGHGGRSALYAARRAGARKLRLITRRAPVDTLRLFDVFSLTYHPVRPLHVFLQEVEILFWCAPVDPDPSWLSWVSPEAVVVDLRLPPSATPWPGRDVIRGDAVLRAHLEASGDHAMDV